MDKNAIKKYAVWARNELIERVTQKAQQYGITAAGFGDENAESINGKLLSDTEKKQRKALIQKIKEDSLEQVMEEVAYTWFNRFTALRFMEVNNYLPSHTRVFTNESNEFKPQILTDAISIDIEGLDIEKVYALKDSNNDEELYKYLLIVQCNSLNRILPGMFQKIADYSELLLPDYLLRRGSVIDELISSIPEDDWKDQVQVIGWLYQSYIAEPKDKLINARGRYKKSDIPFVTQLFTSDWIVKYMVDNTLGRLWIESHPESPMKNNLEYLLTNKDNPTGTSVLDPTSISCIDPCSGSGHILCYLFDVLVQIYEDYGYSARDAVAEIVEKNLWGLDIDDRAAQLAYFSVMMKARQYDRRFFARDIQPHVYVITESNKINRELLSVLGTDMSVEEKRNAHNQLADLLDAMKDAKELGSILPIKQYDWDLLRRFASVTSSDGQMSLEVYEAEKQSELLMNIINSAEAMAKKYEIIVTNPPYMNSSYMPPLLKDYVQEYYADFKSDMFAVFTKRAVEMCKTNGHIGMLTPYVWMFIASYEKMRTWLNGVVNITSLVQLEYNAFEAACVPVASFTFCKTHNHYPGEYVKLSEFRGAENQGPRTLYAISNPECGYRYTANQTEFAKLPNNLIAYWASKTVIESFSAGDLGKVLTTREGMATADNDSFLRLWHEVPYTNIGWGLSGENEAADSGLRWFPYNKGGEYRKWYGNNDYVVNWENNGQLIRNNKDPKTGRIRSHNYNGAFAFRQGITWSALSSSNISVRYCGNGFLFDSKGAKGFSNSEEDLLYALALINSKVGLTYLSFISPTIDFKVGDVIQIPLIKSNVDEVNRLVRECISISKDEWDSYETSWDFKKHPLAQGTRISDEYLMWEKLCRDRFYRLKELEEEINRLLIDTYGLTNEMTPNVKDDEIALRLADEQRDIKSLISYIVGCIFGRYSIKQEGIIYAGGKPFDAASYELVDSDNIVPICNDEYFNDDIVSAFVRYIELIYGKTCLEENLSYIAKVLGGTGSSRDVIRNYFINGFYSDHCADYAVTGSGKRPIYWLFDSGRKNGFKCLMYIHRYQPDIVARIRTDYVHEQQSRYRTVIADLEQRIASASTSERVKLSKQLKTIMEQAEELRKYEEKVHHIADQMINIDVNDGFKENYAKFQDIVAKVK